jgi:alpha-mannosidase
VAHHQTDTRLDRFFSGPYASQHLDTLLNRARYADAPHVKITKWSAPGITKPTFDEAVRKIAQQGEEIGRGYVFGKSWTNHWMKVEIIIPEEARGAEQLICELAVPSYPWTKLTR